MLKIDNKPGWYCLLSLQYIWLKRKGLIYDGYWSSPTALQYSKILHSQLEGGAKLDMKSLVHSTNTSILLSHYSFFCSKKWWLIHWTDRHTTKLFLKFKVKIMIRAISNFLDLYCRPLMDKARLYYIQTVLKKINKKPILFQTW